MGLSAHEQQVLDSIEDGIVRSEPELASLLATFTRLTAGDELPVRERIRVSRLRAARELRGWRLTPRPGTSRRVRRRRERRGWQLAWPLLWLAVSIAMIAVALRLGHGNGGEVCPVRIIACVGQASAHAVWPAAR